MTDKEFTKTVRHFFSTWKNPSRGLIKKLKRIIGEDCKNVTGICEYNKGVFVSFDDRKVHYRFGRRQGCLV